MLLLLAATTLRYTTPSRNADSTRCTDLAETRIYRYGSPLRSHFGLDTAQADTFQVEPVGVYEVTALDSAGNESERSNPAVLGTSDVPVGPPVVPVHSRCGG